MPEVPVNSQLSKPYEDIRGIDGGTYYGMDPWLNDPDNPQVLKAIWLCILQQKQEEAEADGGLPEKVFLLTNPVVVGVDGPYEDADR